MKDRQEVRRAFVTLLYGMSINEQSLLLMISNQEKSKKASRYEGRIEVSAEDYFNITEEAAPYATLSITIRRLSERVLNVGGGVDYNLISLIQEVGTHHREGKVFISFNPILVPYLSEIETTFNYDIYLAKKIKGSIANRFYAFISKYLGAGFVSFSLKELQEKMSGLNELEYFSDYSVRSATVAINDAHINIKIKYTMEDDPSEEVNPIFTFNVVKRYD